MALVNKLEIAKRSNLSSPFTIIPRLPLSAFNVIPSSEAIISASSVISDIISLTSILLDSITNPPASDRESIRRLSIIDLS